MKYAPKATALVLFLCVLSSASSGSEQSQIRIISGAETHGMVNPCECPGTPGGGMASRATAIAGAGPRKELLLLDAGGFAAGGIYDIYTEGRAADSLRTLATLEAMGAIGYDAVGIGDDELQYDPKWLLDEARRAGVPLISANVSVEHRNVPIRNFLVVTRRGRRFGITSVTSPVRLFPLHESVRVRDPEQALRQIWSDLVEKTDYQIVLSHIGEDNAEWLAEQFPEIDVIVNGHRKSSIEPLSLAAGTPVLQFGFQGKQLASSVFALSGKKLLPRKNAWLEVDQSVSADTAVQAVIDKALEGKTAATVYDLYLMAQCPYGLPALAELVAFAEQSHHVEMNVWFIGTVMPGGELESLHGENEIQEETVWLAVKNLYPEKWMSFLKLTSAESASLPEVIRRLSLDSAKLNRWTREKGRELLALHYRRSSRLHVSASPTLLVNNVVSQIPVTRLGLAKVHCVHDSTASDLCNQVPECFEDSDCHAPGQVGICRGEASKRQCEFIQDSAFTVTVLRSSEAHTRPEHEVVATLMRLFPAAAIDTVSLETQRGRELLKQYKPSKAPFYLFDTTVSRAHNYSAIQPRLQRYQSKMTFSGDAVWSNYHIGRRRLPNRKTFFIDPAFDGAAEVVAVLMGDSTSGDSLDILPVVTGDVPQGNPAELGSPANEEALLWLALRSRYPEKYPEYLRLFAGFEGMSRGGLVDSLGLKRADLMAEGSRSPELLGDHLRELRALSIRGPVVLLLENREVIPVAGQLHLRALLKE